MTVTGLEITMLRAHVAGEDEEAQRAFGQQLATTGDLSGLAVLVHAAFVIAARRKFAAGWNRAAVIRYVGRVRALLSERPGLLDPRVAEDEVASALAGQAPAAHEAGAAAAAARLFLLDALIASLALDDEAIDDLLWEARHSADRMLIGMTGQTPASQPGHYLKCTDYFDARCPITSDHDIAVIDAGIEFCLSRTSSREPISKATCLRVLQKVACTKSRAEESPACSAALRRPARLPSRSRGFIAHITRT
jgi:hypothetical protein